MITENKIQDNGESKNLVGTPLALPQSIDEPSGVPPISEEDYLAYINLVPPDNSLPIIGNDDWMDNLIKVKRTNKETKEVFEVIEPYSQNNIYLMTRYCEKLRGIFILNEFSQRKMVVKCPPWERPDKFRPRDVRDDDYPRVCMELERMGLLPSKDRVGSAIESICHDRSFHPVQRYFKSLKWDGVKRLHMWLKYYLGADSDPEEYLSTIGTKWLVAAVARVFKPGCKFDHMLVLEGSTDIGKSKALRTLATFHGEEYFYDGMTFAKIGEKDTMQNIQGSLIIEFPEMSSLHSREVEEVKQWITIQEDRGRKPYGREPIVYPRQFVLAGSTNNYEYLKDTTGNKRFWPVKCGPTIDHKAIENDKGQLWAEAVHLYRDGYPWWIKENDGVVGKIKDAQQKRMVTHPWEEAVINYIKGKDKVTCVNILVNGIGKPLEKVKKSDEMVIAGILKDNGFIRRSDGKDRWWEPKVVQLVLEDIE